MPYHESPDFEATRTFYTRVLGLEEGTSAAVTSASDPAGRRSSSRRQAWSRVRDPHGVVISVLAHE